ncbi:hypothetical protein HELRODRAFT_162057 [Helobdella robusta]|uniref:C2 domain-containing protein n=1 Tax=Helobdella robusta TaxID=6412 RepID=T1ES74_HELRO|nr:hypothetical protein HELRODRAFT_162057 [Helobdella robusta]ESN98621.1 hypothetical protein HELRODRAFT_162057 [Helobdella robusta]
MVIIVITTAINIANYPEKDMEGVKQKLLTVLFDQQKLLDTNVEEIMRSIEGILTLQLKYENLSFEILIMKCKDLPKRTGYLADKSGSMPKPYLKMSFLPRSLGRHSCRTRALPGTCSPEWNQKFTLDGITEEEAINIL